MRWQISLRAIMLWMSAVVLWLCLLTELARAVEVPDHSIRNAALLALDVMTVLVLLGIRASLHRLVRDKPNGWAVAAIIAPFPVFVTAIWLGLG